MTHFHHTKRIAHRRGTSSDINTVHIRLHTAVPISSPQGRNWGPIRFNDCLSRLEKHRRPIYMRIYVYTGPPHRWFKGANRNLFRGKLEWIKWIILSCTALIEVDEYPSLLLAMRIHESDFRPLLIGLRPSSAERKIFINMMWAWSFDAWVKTVRR